MANRFLSIITVAALCALAFLLGRGELGGVARAQERGLTALDYAEITQLINRYAYGIDTCSNNGYDYADLFTADGVFIDKNSDAGFAAGGRVLAKGREALAELVGGGSRGCKTKLVWTDWSHLMLGMRGPGSVDRHGGYEDVYVKTPQGWRIKSRTHVRNKAWHNPLLQTPDLN